MEKAAAVNSAPATPAQATPADTEDRGAKFDRLDARKEGKITREYYTTHSPS